MSSDYSEIEDNNIRLKTFASKFDKIELIDVENMGESYFQKMFPSLKHNQTDIDKPALIVPENNKTGFILILQNPIDRFVTAFNHSKALVEFDLSDYSVSESSVSESSDDSFKSLLEDPSVPFYKRKNILMNKINTGNPFSRMEKWWNIFRINKLF